MHYELATPVMNRWPQTCDGRHCPIVMTTTTVLGLLPMAIGLGEAAELRTPMAITVIGGLLIATLLTLVAIPVVYDLVDRKKIHGDVLEGGESPT